MDPEHVPRLSWVLPSLAREDNTKTSPKHCKCCSTIDPSLAYVRTCILIRKLCFLSRCVESEAISGEVLWSMISPGSTPSLIVQCRYLELPTGTTYTDKILTGSVSNREIREEILKQDIILCKSAASEHASLRHFNHLCHSSSWMTLWDSALEHGVHGTSQTLALLWAFLQPLFSDSRCPLQDDQTCIVPPNIRALEHFCSKHITQSAETIVTSVENRHNSLFS